MKKKKKKSKRTNIQNKSYKILRKKNNKFKGKKKPYKN